jgi:precorrin-2/cobalt-factor-2 C20-methyltransferase
MSIGTVYGVGLGSGDVDLLSVRADRLVRNAKIIAYFRKAGKKGQARRLADPLIPADALEIPMEYPVTTEIPLDDPRYNEVLSQFYEDSCAILRTHLDAGHDIVVLCEGDPFFYGSFMHLHSRLMADYNVEVVPAITGMSGAWTATNQPITWGDDILTVLMGTLDQDTLTARMKSTDALVVMKIGTNFPKVRQALRDANLYDRAWMVQYATMPDQKVTKLSEFDGDKVPYFTIIVVHGQGRRP